MGGHPAEWGAWCAIPPRDPALTEPPILRGIRESVIGDDQLMCGPVEPPLRLIHLSYDEDGVSDRVSADCEHLRWFDLPAARLEPAASTPGARTGRLRLLADRSGDSNQCHRLGVSARARQAGPTSSCRRGQSSAPSSASASGVPPCTSAA